MPASPAPPVRQWFRYFTGVLGLLTSRYALYAAVLLAIVMAVAIIAHVTVVVRQNQIGLENILGGVLLFRLALGRKPGISVSLKSGEGHSALRTKISPTIMTV
jgi:hypothetical protein